jgi:cobalt-zinc-cadmium efflux system outer membrane protein
VKYWLALILLGLLSAASHGQDASYWSSEGTNGRGVGPLVARVSFAPHLGSSRQNSAQQNSAQRDPPARLTLAELEELAFRNNPTLAAAAARIDAARGLRAQAGLYANPVIGYHGTEIGNLGTAAQQGAFISQRFIAGAKLELDRSIAATRIDESHFQFHAQEQRVISDLRIRFFEALVAQRRVELANNLARIGEQLVEATEKLIAGGQASDNDLLQAEIKADEALILRDNAGNELIESWRRLTVVVGVPRMAQYALAGQLDENLDLIEWDSCYTTVLAQNPTLNAANVRANRARIMIRRERIDPIPDVDVSVSVRHHNITTSDIVNVQIGIPIPIFDKNRGNIRRAEAEWIAACNDAKRLELLLQDQLAVAYRRYANAHQQASRYRQRILPRAEKSLTLVTDSYKAGQMQFLPLLAAQQTYWQVNLSYLNSLRELQVASSIIQGQLLTDSLAAPNR